MSNAGDEKTYAESVAAAEAKRAEVSAARKAGPEPDPESDLGPDAYALEAAEATLARDEAEAEAEAEDDEE